MRSIVSILLVVLLAAAVSCQYSVQCDPPRYDKQRPQPNDCRAALNTYDPKGKGYIDYDKSFNQKSCYSCQIEIRSYGPIQLSMDQARSQLNQFLQRCSYTTGTFPVTCVDGTTTTLAVDFGSGRPCY